MSQRIQRYNIKLKNNNPNYARCTQSNSLTNLSLECDLDKLRAFEVLPSLRLDRSSPWSVESLSVSSYSSVLLFDLEDF